MHILPSQTLCRVAALGVASLAIMYITVPVFAAGTASIQMQPYCLEQENNNGVFGGLPDVDELFDYPSGSVCEPFTVKDPTTLQTSVLQEGDFLDMYVIIHNPERKPVQRFRVWIAYDSSVLEGVSLSINETFGIPTPGENAFVDEDGFIKVSGTAFSPVDDAKIFAARILLKVKDDGPSGTPISFFDASGTTASKTAVIALQAEEEQNILQSTLGSLLVRLKGAESESGTTDGPSSEDASSSTATQESSAIHTADVPVTDDRSSADVAADANHTASSETVFRLLQIQNLRLTTEGTNVYLSWDELQSSELVGYNLYYGTTTGRYIQRRSIDRTSSSVTIRSLPTGSTYYFAIRGVHASGEETEFSNEQGISVGNPLTSTSPLTASAIPNSTPGTGGNVSGETGIGSALLIFVLLSAITGTFLAFKRQVHASLSIHD